MFDIMKKGYHISFHHKSIYVMYGGHIDIYMITNIACILTDNINVLQWRRLLGLTQVSA